MFKIQSETRGEQTGLIDEMIGNQKVVQVFGRGEDVTERFDEINERLNRASLRATFFSSITNPSTRFINSLVYTGVRITGAFAVVRGSLTVGQLSSFLSYANQYTKPFNEISGVVTEFQNAIACAQRVFELIEEEPQIPEPEQAVVLKDIDGNVKIEDVSFSYVPEQKLIEDFNLDVKPGQKIAIVGPTGCGKTTLINLLMRFYDVTGGQIKVENIDIREVTRKVFVQDMVWSFRIRGLRQGQSGRILRWEDRTRQRKRSLGLQKHLTSTVIFPDFQRDTIHGSQKTVVVCHRDRSSCYVLRESCCAVRQC